MIFEIDRLLISNREKGLFSKKDNFTNLFLQKLGSGLSIFQKRI